MRLFLARTYGFLHSLLYLHQLETVLVDGEIFYLGCGTCGKEWVNRLGEIPQNELKAIAAKLEETRE